ncbi:MAG: thioesterase family protein [Rubritalea sp.]
MKTYLYQHSVPFQDTDMAGVVHYTRILGYAELAEHAFLTKLGITPISKSGGLPKVHVECDYQSPLRFADDVTIELSLIEFSTRSIHWAFKITTNDKIAALGKFSTAYVGADGKPSEMPSHWQSLLGK